MVKGHHPIDKRIKLLNWVENNRIYLDTCTSGRSKMYMAHKIASILYVLDEPNDTVINYLEIAKDNSPFRTCRMLIDLNKKFNNPMSKTHKGNYFAKEVSEEWWSNFVTDCYNAYDPHQLQMPKKDNMTHV